MSDDDGLKAIGQVIQIGAVPEHRMSPGGGNLPGPGNDGLLAGIAALAAVVPEFRQAEGINFPHHVGHPEAPGQCPGRGQLCRRLRAKDRGDLQQVDDEERSLTASVTRRA